MRRHKRGPSFWLYLSLCTSALVIGPLVIIAANADAGELLVIPVSALQKKQLTQAHGAWSSALALELRPLDEKIYIRERTEFYAVYLDRERRHLGRKVVFSWYHGPEKRRFALPVAVTVRRGGGSEDPWAAYACWSAPNLGGRLLSAGGFRSLQSRRDWNNSRCYGPRTIRVTDENGALLAERSFEIHEPGVTIY